MRPSARLTLAAAFTALLAHPLAAQSPADPFIDRNAVYVEAGGNALLYSMNYERMIIAGLTVRVGVAFVPAWFPWVEEDDDGALLTMVPVQVGMVFRPGNHHVEMGAGATFGNASVDIGDLEGSESWVFGTGTLGYRYQRPEGGIVFRAALTPLFIEVLDMGMLPMIGLSLGHTF
jgi:hypothetical protein